MMKNAKRLFASTCTAAALLAVFAASGCSITSSGTTEQALMIRNLEQSEDVLWHGAADWKTFIEAPAPDRRMFGGTQTDFNALKSYHASSIRPGNQGAILVGLAVFAAEQLIKAAADAAAKRAEAYEYKSDATGWTSRTYIGADATTPGSTWNIGALEFRRTIDNKGASDGTVQGMNPPLLAQQVFFVFQPVGIDDSAIGNATPTRSVVRLVPIYFQENQAAAATSDERRLTSTVNVKLRATYRDTSGNPRSVALCDYTFGINKYTAGTLANDNRSFASTGTAFTSKIDDASEPFALPSAAAAPSGVTLVATVSAHEADKSVLAKAFKGLSKLILSSEDSIIKVVKKGLGAE